MNIRIATPAPRGSRGGNRVTAGRWERIPRQIGHQATAGTGLGKACNLLIARKSAPSIRRLGERTGDTPPVIGIAGTGPRPPRPLSTVVAHHPAPLLAEIS